MICYVVTETIEKYREMQSHELKLDLERLSGDRCLVMHFSEITREFIDEVRPWAICHSGGSTAHDEYDVLEREDYRWLIRESGVPQLGFCGGCQLIAEMFGGEVAPMRPLADGEPDLAPDYHQGSFKEWGVWPVRVVAGRLARAGRRGRSALRGPRQPDPRVGDAPQRGQGAARRVPPARLH